MDLHWKLCPYCGNNHIDPYQVGPPLILAEDIVAAREDSSLGEQGEEQEAELLHERLAAVELESMPDDTDLD